MYLTYSKDLLCESDPARRPTERIFTQAAPVLDAIWYPTASSQDPASYCFVASVRECPVKLIDASDGRLRASYSIVDHRERQVSPHSLVFDVMAQTLYCGFEDAIEIFDVNRPGQEGRRLRTTPSKKSRDGLKGIISSLAFCPSYDHSILAAGSFTPSESNIMLLSEETPILSVGGGPRAGVSQLSFSPTQTHILLASYRQNESIYAWDIRGSAEKPVAVYSYGSSMAGCARRRRLTNQRTRFSIDWSGRWLATGDQRGDIHVFDIGSHSVSKEEDSSFVDTKETSPCRTFSAHKDAIGSVSFNNYHPVLLSAAGSRHFADDVDTDSDEAFDEEDVERVLKGEKQLVPWIEESSLGLWNFLSQSPNEQSTDTHAP